MNASRNRHDDSINQASTVDMQTTLQNASRNGLAAPSLTRQPEHPSDGRQRTATEVDVGMCRMPPTRIFAISHMEGSVCHIRMSTLSWFWVPVIAHAIGIHMYPGLPPDHHLFNTGALFSLSELTAVVRHLVRTGMYSVQGNEWNGMIGNQFYVAADSEAQDRLMHLLLSSQVVGSSISNLMQLVVNWFDCLWAAQIERLSVPQTQNARLAMAAAVAPHWRRSLNGPPVFVPSAGGLNPVWL
jgi:hypothetical protein